MSQIMRYAILLALIVSTAGCAARMREKMRAVDLAMNRAEVIRLLGRPDGVKREGDYEALAYSHRVIAYGSLDRADYHVILKDNKVVEYGAGEVRVKDGGILVVVPIH